MTRFPAAESFADSIKLPLVACPVTKEMYGHIHLILNENRATRVVSSAGYLVGTDEYEAAMEVLRHRADNL